MDVTKEHQASRGRLPCPRRGRWAGNRTTMWDKVWGMSRPILDQGSASHSRPRVKCDGVRTYVSYR